MVLSPQLGDGDWVVQNDKLSAILLEMLLRRSFQRICSEKRFLQVKKNRSWFFLRLSDLLQTVWHFFPQKSDNFFAISWFLFCLQIDSNSLKHLKKHDTADFEIFNMYGTGTIVRANILYINTVWLKSVEKWCCSNFKLYGWQFVILPLPPALPPLFQY